MPALTEREMLIARITFRNSTNALMEMARAGFDIEHICRLALDDPQSDDHLREKIERELCALEELRLRNVTL